MLDLVESNKILPIEDHGDLMDHNKILLDLVESNKIPVVLVVLTEREVSPLDHNLLNEIPGLETPSLENISRWIAGQLAATFPGLAWVKIARPSCNEYCTYRLA